MATSAIIGQFVRKNLVWLVFLAVNTPLLLLHFHNLWQRPFYRGFPCLLVGFCVLLYQRGPRRDGWTAQSSRAMRSRRRVLRERTLLASSSVAFVVSVTIFSPWLAMVSAVLAAGGLLSRLESHESEKRLLPVWLMLWLLIPPPGGLDVRFIRWLHGLVVHIGSEVLDLFRLDHLLE